MAKLDERLFSRILACFLCIIVLSFFSPVHAAAVNPFIAFTTVLFQWDYFNKLGPTDHYLSLNIQPSVPFHLNDKIDLISLSDIPINSEMKMIFPNSHPMVLGDIQENLFFSQANTGNFYAGFGPVLLFPTATTAQYGSEKWGAGPTLMLANFEDEKNYGLIANHVWSFAGNPSRSNISQTFLNPWITFNLSKN